MTTQESGERAESSKKRKRRKDGVGRLIWTNGVNDIEYLLRSHEKATVFRVRNVGYRGRGTAEAFLAVDAELITLPLRALPAAPTEGGPVPVPVTSIRQFASSSSHTIVIAPF